MKNITRKIYHILKSYFSQPQIVNSSFRNEIKRIVLLFREKHYARLTETKKRTELIKWYYKQTGETLNLDNSENFNQKIQWLKLYDNTPIKTILSDKYLVRDWIKNQIGQDYLISIYGVWNDVDKIPFDDLPLKFVLKANHGSGMNYVVTDKTKEDYNKLRKMAKKWLKTPYDMSSMEQQYYAIPRKIIAEEYIEQADGNLLDYKIHCFKGIPRIIQVIGDRDLIHHSAKEAYLDVNWTRNNNMYNTYAQYDKIPERPECLEQMLSIASKLSSEFEYVRVDLYVLDNKIKFGEMTFTPAAGIGKWGYLFENRLVGSWITLPNHN